MNIRSSILTKKKKERKKDKKIEKTAIVGKLTRPLCFGVLGKRKCRPVKYLCFEREEAFTAAMSRGPPKQSPHPFTF